MTDTGGLVARLAEWVSEFDGGCSPRLLSQEAEDELIEVARDAYAALRASAPPEGTWEQRYPDLAAEVRAYLGGSALFHRAHATESNLIARLAQVADVLSAPPPEGGQDTLRGDCRKCGEGMRLNEQGECERCGRTPVAPEGGQGAAEDGAALCVCGHSYSAHSGHTIPYGSRNITTHCSQGDDCYVFRPALRRAAPAGDGGNG